MKAAGIAPGSRSVQHAKTIGDKKGNGFETVKSPRDREREEEMALIRRKLNNHILKN